MPDPDEKPAQVTQDVLGADLTSVEGHLERRFPDADSDEIQEAIGDAAGNLADARITTFRSLLVEHNASDLLRDDTDNAVAEPDDSDSRGPGETESGHPLSNQRDPRDRKIEQMQVRLDEVRDDIDAAKRQIEHDGDMEFDEALPVDPDDRRAKAHGPAPGDPATPVEPPG